MSAKPAKIGASLITVTKKGEAKPSVLMPETAIQENTKPATTQPMAAESAPAEKPSDYYKSLTVKLDKARYAALKLAGTTQDKKSQEIFVEALDAWLKLNT